MADAFPLAPVEPVRDPQATLTDLIEVLLNRGVILHLDLIISVADIPLIGVSLKAAIAGIETMLEYGMMRAWDEQTRAWVQRSITRTVPFQTDEELVARMAGAHEHTALYRSWRPGTVYLTNNRLFVFRREPREMLWETTLEAIRSIAPEREQSVGGEERTRVRVELADGSITRLSASEPERLIELVRQEIPAAIPGESRSTTTKARLLYQGQLWYHEPRAGGPVWRGGQARIDSSGFTWKAPVDARAAISLQPDEIRSLRFESDHSPTGTVILVVDVPWGSLRLAAQNITDIANALVRFSSGRKELPKPSE